jgi:hypothetical protein
MTNKKSLYLDTSVFGGCFDSEFDKPSLSLIKKISEGQFKLFISSVTLLEISKAPNKVQSVLETIPLSNIETLPPHDSVELLKKAYLSHKVIPDYCELDAEHIAYASVYNADAIVSWNFKHIVNMFRIKGFQGVNLQYGFRAIDIFSPQEIVHYDNE